MEAKLEVLRHLGGILEALEGILEALEAYFNASNASNALALIL